MTKRMAIVLAAGKGTRMKSKLHKVLHALNGQPMIELIIRSLQAASVDKIVTVVGYQADQVKQAVGDRSDYAYQEEQLGTGHAVLQAEDLLGQEEGTTLVISGDTPLMTAATLQALFDNHEASGVQASLLTGLLDNSKGYGRVIRKEDGSLDRIVEEKDANEAERAIKEVNTGIYIFDNQKLFSSLKRVTNDNAQAEYYLPDVLTILQEDGDQVNPIQLDDMNEAIGINDRVALAGANKILQRRINKGHMLNGVTLIDPDTTFIGLDVEIGQDTIIEGNVYLKGHTQIGPDSYISSGFVIEDCQIGPEVVIRASYLEKSVVGKGSDIGPFAHLRPNSVLAERVHIGNFVEVKNSTIGNHTKAGHLSYIGDADLGEDINIGCGTTFVNFDGQHKYRTEVGDQTFVGSGVNLIAPLKVAPRSILAAGSTIYEDVEEESLAIARSRQSVSLNYWKKFKNK